MNLHQTFSGSKFVRNVCSQFSQPKFLLRNKDALGAVQEQPVMNFVHNILTVLKHGFISLFQVIFSDESIIAVGLLEDRVQTVCRRSAEELLPSCLKKTVKFPAKITIWEEILVY